MHANSPPIESTQTGPHPRLAEVLARHREKPNRRPYAEHSQAAAEQLLAWLQQSPAPLVLDSGCGTGASTAVLAQRYPDCRVAGVDQSLQRLSRFGPLLGQARALTANALLLRANLEDLWRLLHAAGWRLQRHLLWYPNPWPKPEHLMRRWHAHPVFPTLLDLGGELELRSNWRIYVDEFAQALAAYGIPSTLRQIAANAPADTPFERKYQDSGHPLWQLSAHLPGASA
jgi:tRNA (guanine-N7-)-methyltransferase